MEVLELENIPLFFPEPSAAASATTTASAINNPVIIFFLPFSLIKQSFFNLNCPSLGA